MARTMQASAEALAVALRNHMGLHVATSTFSLEAGEVLEGPPSGQLTDLVVQPDKFQYPVSVKTGTLTVPDHLALEVGDLVWMIFVPQISIYQVICRITGPLSIAVFGSSDTRIEIDPVAKSLNVIGSTITLTGSTTIDINAPNVRINGTTQVGNR